MGIQSQAVEAVKPSEPVDVVFLPLTVTATFSVPSTYLLDIEGCTGYIRSELEDIATGLMGAVYSVEIK